MSKCNYDGNAQKTHKMFLGNHIYIRYFEFHKTDGKKNKNNIR